MDDKTSWEQRGRRAKAEVSIDPSRKQTKKVTFFFFFSDDGERRSERPLLKHRTNGNPANNYRQVGGQGGTKGLFCKTKGGETDSGRLILRVKSDKNKVPDELTATQPGFHSPYFKCNFPRFISAQPSAGSQRIMGRVFMNARCS